MRAGPLASSHTFNVITVHAFKVVLRNLFTRRLDTLPSMPIQRHTIAWETIRWFFLPVLLILPFATGLPLVGQSDSTTYLFDHSLNAEEAGVVPLTAIDPLGQNAFVSSNVFGITQTVYRFDGNPLGVDQAGLQLDITDLLSSNSEYSVELVFRFTEGAGRWRRVLDAKNRDTDDGLYVSDGGRLIVPGAGASGSTNWAESVFHHVVLTTSEGEVNDYLDGSPEFAATTEIFNVGQDNLLTFFADNYLGAQPENGEVADGEVALIRLYDLSLSADDVERLAMSLLDIDGDGVNNDEDAFVNDPAEWEDTDGDSIGNNADEDDDGDGIPDEEDPLPLVAKVRGILPPEQDYYLHHSQYPHWKGEVAWVQTPGDLVVNDTLTVEAWVLWEGSDYEEFQAATGIDADQMSLMCGQRAYGFQYRIDGVEGWTFFLQTDEEVVRNTGQIPLPLGEWVHLAATYDGSMIRTFLNGVEQTATPCFGQIPSSGDRDTFYEQCRAIDDSVGVAPEEIFGIGLGLGFMGGIRQLRIWSRALTRAEIVAHAGLHLNGTEAGLVAYWPLDGPPDPLQSPNKVPNGPPLLLDRGPGYILRPVWRLMDPLFVIREDLAEDAFVTDCPSLPLPHGLNSDWLVDVQNDGDLDFFFTGATGGACASGLTAFRTLIREGDQGFVFDTASAFAGEIPLVGSCHRAVTADFNGDAKEDLFCGNVGEDFCGDAGATNTLLLSRPDGRLEDASGNLLGAPCDAETPQFEGQHMCYAGGAYGNRPPGIRFPGPGDLAPLVPDFTHDVAAADTDSDGDVDILVGNVTHNGIEPAYMLLNDGLGQFEANWELLPDYMYWDNIEAYRFDPPGFLLEDLDGDGHVDLVTAPYVLVEGRDWTAGISWNDGTGDFSSADRLVIVPTAGIPTNQVM